MGLRNQGAPWPWAGIWLWQACLEARLLPHGLPCTACRLLCGPLADGRVPTVTLSAGATCYLNSWLQTLFNINCFRQVRRAH